MMKKLFVLALTALLISCNSDSGYTIKINMPDFGGSEIALNQNVDGNLVLIDSVILDSTGVGELKGSVAGPEMMYLGPKNTRQNLSVFMDNYKYTISGSLEEVSIVANGGPHVAFEDYKDATQEYSDKMQEIANVYRQAAAAGAEKDSISAILDDYYAINDEKTAFDSSYIADNSASIVAVYLLRGQYHQMKTEELETALSTFDESLHSTSYYTHMANHLEKMKNVAIGMDYVDFELPDADGNIVKLSELAGKGILLVDFWASWCSPCRNANPGVVALYNEFHEKGFDVLGVSLDNDKEAWLKAIEDDKLTWTHISDIKGWQCAAAQTYAVSSIPHTVLLDKTGKIVAKNLSEEELKAKIEELLAE